MTKKEQRFRKIRKRGIWGGFIAMIVLTVLLLIGMYFFARVSGYLLLSANLHGEHSRLQSIAKLYDEDITDDQIRAFFGGDTRSYIVKDLQGKVVFKNCEDTIGEESSKITLRTEMELKEGESPDFDVRIEWNPNTDGEGAEGDSKEEGLQIAPAVIDDDAIDEMIDKYSVTEESVEVYPDAKKPVIIPKSGGLTLNKNPLAIMFDESTMDQDAFFAGKEPIELPYWLVFPVKDGQQIFYGRAIYLVYLEDVALLGAVIAAIAILLLVAAIVLLKSFFGALHKQKKLTNLLFMDEATGGHNWMWFLIRVGAYLRRRRNDKYNFAICDLVFVKYRNFCMCHSVAKGEELLTRVDYTVNSLIDRKKEGCAHYASANFALLLRYNAPEELETRLHEMLSALEEIDTEHNFNFHLGVYMLPAATGKNGKLLSRKKLDLDEAYNNACTARSTLADDDSSAIAFFDDKLVAEQKWLDIVMEEQKKALLNEEFLVYYQPKYNPVSGKLSGAEALIRWQSPKYGFLTPGKFIPIFEKNGFITEIDHYMLSHVAQDQKRWLDEGRKCVPVSVNVSRAHFIEHDLAEQIRDIVDAAGAPHHLIEIELTESAFFDDKKAIINVIRRLKEYGFTVSMDDFGSGYSSLNSLKDMPLDVLKLDADFFRGEADKDRGEIVVKEALRLAKALQMKTVAEGVEIKEQVEFLADQGCDMIQGFYFAEPMPAGAYEVKMDEAMWKKQEKAAAE